MVGFYYMKNKLKYYSGCKPEWTRDLQGILQSLSILNLEQKTFNKRCKIKVYVLNLNPIF